MSLLERYQSKTEVEFFLGFVMSSLIEREVATSLTLISQGDMIMAAHHFVSKKVMHERTHSIKDDDDKRQLKKKK